jgi:hypothetical protein
VLWRYRGNVRSGSLPTLWTSALHSGRVVAKQRRELCTNVCDAFRLRNSGAGALHLPPSPAWRVEASNSWNRLHLVMFAYHSFIVSWMTQPAEEDNTGVEVGEQAAHCECPASVDTIGISASRWMEAGGRLSSSELSVSKVKESLASAEVQPSQRGFGKASTSSLHRWELVSGQLGPSVFNGATPPA